MLTEPVKICVLLVELPKVLEPEEYTTEELIVVTANVCAVKVPVTIKLVAKEEVAAYVAVSANVVLTTTEEEYPPLEATATPLVGLEK